MSLIASQKPLKYDNRFLIANLKLQSLPVFWALFHSSFVFQATVADLPGPTHSPGKADCVTSFQDASWHNDARFLAAGTNYWHSTQKIIYRKKKTKTTNTTAFWKYNWKSKLLEVLPCWLSEKRKVIPLFYGRQWQSHAVHYSQSNQG